MSQEHRRIKRLLVANRGEIAVRIMRAAAEMEIETVAVHSDDDADALHRLKADGAAALGGVGPRAYLDAARIVAAAREAGCDAVHPGYGFLSENADFARACAAAGLVFVGPDPETLELFGDKSAARLLAEETGVPLLPGTRGPTVVEEARDFLASLGPGGAIMVKAAAGGGGRGMRPVTDASQLEEAFARCASEAKAAFGSDALYVERLIRRARHIEVQVIGDGEKAIHLWERDCTLQRRRQKIVEIAPAPGLDPSLRARLLEAALTLARAKGYRSLGTFEFLIDREAGDFAFMEANPRLQVEHTVTEEITGLDLVRLQLRIAMGETLAGLGLTEPPAPRGHAIQLRINAETMEADGTIKPSSGALTAFDQPSGRGVRVDTAGFAGGRTNPAFDALLAKLIAHDPSPDYADAARRAYRALCEFRIEGVRTNIPLLRNLLRRPEFAANDVDTGFLEAHAAELLREDGDHPLRHAAPTAAAADARAEERTPDAPPGAIAVEAPLEGTVVAVQVEEGAEIEAGAPILVLEAMKMEHLVTAESAGRIAGLLVRPGDLATEGRPVAWLIPSDRAGAAEAEAETLDPDHIRPDLAEAMDRRRRTLDEARPEAVAKRRRTGQRTARENISDLVDEGSLVEYGGLTVAARRSRNTMAELIERTPADGLVAGVARVNGDLFSEDRTQCAVMSYDYTVLAGTQGWKGHDKTDRMLEVARRQRLPLVFFTEGGGGRPGDTDIINAGGLDTPTFARIARLSGLVPLVGVVSGRCFAGNAVALGVCDVIIATENANIGMGGPAMIEGGGLGVFRP
ncbi:MAG: biotin carboxylase N-terminal domain-containing protein, partial [Pikeienuella sp.]